MELPIAQEALESPAVPRAIRRPVFILHWRRAPAGRVGEQAVRVGDDILTVKPHSEVVHLLTRDAAWAGPGLGVQDERGDADERLGAPAANAFDCARFVQGGVEVVLEVGLGGEHAVTCLAVVMSALFMRKETSLCLKDIAAALTNIVIKFSVFE